MSPLSLQGTAQQPVNLDHLDFHLWGHLQPLVYSPPTENEERDITNTFLTHVKPFANIPGLLKGCDSPSSVFMHALFQV
jgi:hypothetical protein